MFHHVLLILCVRLGGEAPQEPGGGRRDLGQVSGREGVTIAPMRKEDLDTDPSPFVKIDSKWGSKEKTTMHNFGRKRENLCDLQFGNELLNKAPKAWSAK